MDMKCFAIYVWLVVAWMHGFNGYMDGYVWIKLKYTHTDLALFSC